MFRAVKLIRLIKIAIPAKEDAFVESYCKSVVKISMTARERFALKCIFAMSIESWIAMLIAN